MPAHCPKATKIGTGDGAGAFAGTLVVPGDSLYPIGPGTAEHLSAYVLADGVACVLNALSRLTQIPDRVGIVGRGSIAQSARVVASMRWGIPVEMLDDTEERQAWDLVIEAAGGDDLASLSRSVDLCARRGTVLSLGVFAKSANWQQRPREWLEREVAVVGVNSYRLGQSTDDFLDAIKLIGEAPDVFSSMVYVGGYLSDENYIAEQLSNRKPRPAPKTVLWNSNCTLRPD